MPRLLLAALFALALLAAAYFALDALDRLWDGLLDWIGRAEGRRRAAKGLPPKPPTLLDAIEQARRGPGRSHLLRFLAFALAALSALASLLPWLSGGHYEANPPTTRSGEAASGSARAPAAEPAEPAPSPSPR